MTKSRLVVSFLFIIAFCNVFAGDIHGDNIDNIYSEFSSAPDSSRTKVWWFHGETETTHEGITADLEAFKEAGVGGVVYYDQVHGDAKGAFPVFSPEWWNALIFSASEAKRLGLSFEINLSNGFVAGGPWITKRLSMKRLCKREIMVDGGSRFDGVLPAPSNDEFWDIKVLAFPVPENVEWDDKVLVKERIISEKPLNLVYDFGKPYTARSFIYSENTKSKHPTAAMNYPGPPADKFYGDGYFEFPPIGSLEVSDDGVNYKPVREIPPLYNIHHKVKTISFPAATGRYFRLNLHDWNRADKQNYHPVELRSAILSSKAMTDFYEARAGFVSEYLGENITPNYCNDEIIKGSEIVDLTSRMKADGHLVWDVPKGGKWVIMRVAQTSTGGRVKHGRPGQMGLECDKLSQEAATVQWNNFAKVIINTLSIYGLKPYGVVMDSHEMGAQNWTHGYENEFERIQGYDVTPYIPALFGYIVDSKDKSEQVLFDHRKTIAKLVSERYFGALDTLAMNDGVMFTAQAMGNNQGMVTDNISIKGTIRRPQGEFWGKHAHGSYDVKEASSAAHIYGKRIASAEAYTDAKYSQPLSYLKSLADYAYSDHLNEFVVCASAYQPWTDKYPGNTANGREYCLNRNNTMWSLSKGFWDYQSRCAYMMRQGLPVVDLCVYLGSDVPVKLLSYRLPDIPEGYSWDVCTDDALMNVFNVADGKLCAPSGMTYNVLVIEKDAILTPDAKCRIKELIEAGIKVYDARKYGSYGLSKYLSDITLEPDVTIQSGNRPDNRVLFAHCRISDNDIYFLANHSDSIWSRCVSFRDSKGRKPEFWNPDNGMRYSIKSNGGEDEDVSFDISLKPFESGFVVLRHGSSPEPLISRTTGEKELVIPISDSWSVDFMLPSGRKTVKMNDLKSWTEQSDEDIKYHSGRAIYNGSFATPSVTDKSKRFYVRIRGLESVSKVYVNGHDAGYLWCSPWEVDVTEYLNHDTGNNIINIEVANQLTNRMIGDMKLPEDERVTYATTPIVKPDDELLPAGITGGVEIVVR